MLDAAWEAIDPAAHQVGLSPVIAHDYLMREYTAKEEGYVFMYISNENTTLVDVYFDDVVMTYTPSNVIQYNEFYPFGLQTANSWTRENVTGNNFLGNGGTEFNNTSNLYDLDYRNYDPILGRMNGVDPMATKYASLSPYNFSFNDPVTFNDPSGADPNQERRSFLRNEMQQHTWNSMMNPYRTHGIIGDDDLMYGHSFARFGAGANWGAHEEFFQQKGIINALQQLFKNATFSSGGRNGFWIKTTGINRATEGTKLPDGTPVTAELMIRNIFVSGVSQDHFNTMLNPVVQRMHEGSREFAAHPFGGGLLAFVSGGGLFGAGSGALARLGAKQFLMNGARAVTRHFTSLGVKQIATSTGMNLASQIIVKQDLAKVDVFDAAVAGLSGNKFIISGILGASLDISPFGTIETFNDKGFPKTSNDLITGVVFGGANQAFSSFFPGTAGQNLKNDFLWQLGGEGLNWVLNEGK